MDCLKRLMESFALHRELGFEYEMIIADDGSSDGTLDYLNNFQLENIPVHVVRNNRQGIHHQFNTIVNMLQSMSYDVCFKCDDDIQFIKKGWEAAYLEGIGSTGFDHLCYFNKKWRPRKNLRNPVRKNNLISYCRGQDVQGAFFTITPRVIEKIGFMDTRNFGFRGVGHIDYTLRACRAGFNEIENPFDIKGSDLYISQPSGYSSALSSPIVQAFESESESKRKYNLALDNSRLYVEYYENPPTLTIETERDLLAKRLSELLDEKLWYQEQYDHQPKWYVRLGKLIFKSRGLTK